ncbi:YeeE/YedE family protein [Methylobacillus gramineus]|uniref:YeeE/YedE family protein n=1 Tax=Methylobacillus gramineus TaxID=755169 RepID=UPI001CFF5BDA|nr:YeeE/YedE thiosulfate transporter family protein [Methylobacillus gramineus]MCB5185092.1 YeeE/YedE family protein [Methylobacillus gramineus]
MSIDWNAFTPWSSLAGGLLIGLSAAALILLNGRIAGISGILGGLLQFRSLETGWRLAFITGLILAPLLYGSFTTLPSVINVGDLSTLAIAGLLVGFGTSLGNGCTSGHGVCGLSRLSLRSLIATLLFMGSGFLTVFLLRHVFS